jgi:hypothetical protein
MRGSNIGTILKSAKNGSETNQSSFEKIGSNPIRIGFDASRTFEKSLLRTFHRPVRSKFRSRILTAFKSRILYPLNLMIRLFEIKNGIFLRIYTIVKVTSQALKGTSKSPDCLKDRPFRASKLLKPRELRNRPYR